MEWQSTGSPPSAFRVPYDSFRDQCDGVMVSSQDVNTSADVLEENNSKDLNYDFLCFFLSSRRVDLYKLIDYRCEDMLSGRSCCETYLCFLFSDTKNSQIHWSTHLFIVDSITTSYDSVDYFTLKGDFILFLLSVCTPTHTQVYSLALLYSLALFILNSWFCQ